MSEPILERLSRFTPDVGRLDRDALLFAAGRDSARPNRGWIALASLLASTQALSLALFWPHANQRSASPVVSIATAPEPSAIVEPGAPEAWANPGFSTARHALREPEIGDRPAADVTLLDSGPPLQAYGPLPQSLLN